MKKQAHFNLPEDSSSQSKTRTVDYMRSLGGVTTVQASNLSPADHFCKCIPIGESGILGLVALKSSITFFAIVDIIMGIFYCLQLAGDVILEWKFFNLNGPHYLLMALYLLRPLCFIYGIIGLIASIKVDAPHAKTYYRMKQAELAVIPLLSIVATIDMCNSYVYGSTCKDLLGF